jgi:hypothetical protein
MSRSETEKAIILTTYGQLIVSKQLRVLDNTRDTLLKKLNQIDFLLIKQEQKLTTEQYDDLQSKYNSVVEGIKRMPIDICRMARWYYEELIDEVNGYFLSIKSVDMNVGEITNSVLNRFRRDCENTLSEKMIVYTTLGEILVKQSWDIPYEIVSEIKRFDVNDTKDQLLQVEKDQLINLINKVLEKSDASSCDINELTAEAEKFDG